MKWKDFLKKTKGAVIVDPKHVPWRTRYLHVIMSNRQNPIDEYLREVYTYESYIHHHYWQSTRDLYHLSVEKQTAKEPYKSCRFCKKRTKSNVNSKLGLDILRQQTRRVFKENIINFFNEKTILLGSRINWYLHFMNYP